MFVQCSSEKAQKEVRNAVGRAEAAEATVTTLSAENERLRETIVRANEAVERALTLILEAQDKHEKRIETIESDPAASDWLACELPDSVREAFADYYRH
jgi:predicted  nucleic acid-binding Zn-ribbon protein